MTRAFKLRLATSIALVSRPGKPDQFMAWQEFVALKALKHPSVRGARARLVEAKAKS